MTEKSKDKNEKFDEEKALVTLRKILDDAETKFALMGMVITTIPAILKDQVKKILNSSTG